MLVAYINTSSVSFFLILAYSIIFFFFFFNDTATTEIYTLSLHDALPIARAHRRVAQDDPLERPARAGHHAVARSAAEVLAGRPGERRGRHDAGRDALGRSDRLGHHLRDGTPQTRRRVEQRGRRAVAHRRGRYTGISPPRPAHCVRARSGRGVLLHSGRLRSGEDRGGVPRGARAAAGERP